MKLQILFDEEGRIIGTAQPELAGAERKNKDAPAEVRIVPGPGQQLADLYLEDDGTDIKNAVALHARLRREIGC